MLGIRMPRLTPIQASQVLLASCLAFNERQSPFYLERRKRDAKTLTKSKYSAKRESSRRASGPPIRVDGVGICGGHTVRQALVRLQDRALHQFGIQGGPRRRRVAVRLSGSEPGCWSVAAEWLDRRRISRRRPNRRCGIEKRMKQDRSNEAAAHPTQFAGYQAQQDGFGRYDDPRIHVDDAK
jgi:hypothetical protein